MDIELQILPRHGDSPASERDSSTGSERGGAPQSSEFGSSSSRPKNGSSQRSESNASERDDPQKPQLKYGSRLPECPSSDTKVSQWIPEAEREVRRLTVTERTKTCEAEQLKCDTQSLRPAIVVGRSARRHRGCSFRLPTSELITIPTIPYDPLDLRWMHQEHRRQCSRVKKKEEKTMRALAKTGFDVQMSDDADDYDSDDDVYNQNGQVQCSIFSRPPETEDEELEVAMDVTPHGESATMRSPPSSLRIRRA